MSSSWPAMRRWFCLYVPKCVRNSRNPPQWPNRKTSAISWNNGQIPPSSNECINYHTRGVFKNPSARSVRVCLPTERPWSPRARRSRRSYLGPVSHYNPKWRPRTALSLVRQNFHWNLKWVACACKCIWPRHYRNIRPRLKNKQTFVSILYVCIEVLVKLNRHCIITRTVDSIRKYPTDDLSPR